MSSSMPSSPHSSWLSSRRRSCLDSASFPDCRRPRPRRTRQKSHEGTIARPPSYPNISSESGTTTIEVIVAIAIIAFVATAAAGAFSGGLKSFAKSNLSIIRTTTILKIDDAVRSACRGVFVPYWDRHARINATGEAFTIPYWQGKADSTVIISNTKSGLSIATPEGVRIFAVATLVSVTALPDEKTGLRGIKLTYRISDQELSTIAPFASGPLGSASK
jgi:type II secretory pathway pseudopilin PulG